MKRQQVPDWRLRRDEDRLLPSAVVELPVKTPAITAWRHWIPACTTWNRGSYPKEEHDMTEQLDDLKAMLTKKRTELVRAIRSQSSQLNVGEVERDLIDRMQGMSRREETVTFLDSLSRTLASVDTALLAIQDGSYGDCAECGQPIAPRRLAAIPWASNCIRCQEALDRCTHINAIPQWDEAA
jgi:DnaK suppressor protein